MVKIYYDKDADLSIFKGRTIAVIGYGNQGVAQANCIKDSGLDVIIGLIPQLDKSWDPAKMDGLTVGPKIIDAHVRRNMEKAVKRVQNGAFAREWLREDKKGCPIMNSLLTKWEDNLLGETGDFIRRMSEVGKKT